jgi:hypothetical protein
VRVNIFKMLIILQGGSNITGTMYVNKSQFVPVIFEPPCIIKFAISKQPSFAYLRTMNQELSCHSDSRRQIGRLLKLYAELINFLIQHNPICIKSVELHIIMKVVITITLVKHNTCNYRHDYVQHLIITAHLLCVKWKTK